MSEYTYTIYIIAYFCNTHSRGFKVKLTRLVFNVDYTFLSVLKNFEIFELIFTVETPPNIIHIN